MRREGLVRPSAHYVKRATPAERKDRMIRMTITSAVISQGYNGAPALSCSEKEGTKFVRFRVGATVYDKTAEKNRRYINMTVKAFNGAATRIESMKLDAGKYVNIVGRYDEETWDDKTTHEKKSAPVLIVDEIEFCYSGTGKQDSEDNGASVASGSSQVSTAESNQAPGNFTGYESFGGGNPYFPEEK